MKNLLKLFKILIISLFLINGSTALGSDYRSNLRFDRESLFYNVCMDLLGSETHRADSLCYRYSEDVSGDNFDEIIRSMQTAFNNIHRRNPKSVPFRIKLNPKKVKREFKKIVKENNRPADYETSVLNIAPVAEATAITVMPEEIVTRSAGADLNVVDVSPGNEGESSYEGVSSDSGNTSVAKADNLPEKETISKEFLYEEANKVLLKRICMKIDTSAPMDKHSKCNKASDDKKDLSVEDTLESIDQDYKRQLEEKLYKKALIEVGDRIVEKDNLIKPADYNEYVNNGGPKSKDKSVAEIKVEIEEEPEVIVTRPIAAPVIVMDKQDGNTSDDARKLIISDYEEILKSEIDKLCPTKESLCVQGVVKDVYHLRDEALAKLDDPKNEVVAMPVVDENSQSEVVNTIADQNISSKQSEVNCSDDIQVRLKELLAEDEGNILGKQFQLTSLKMALQIMEDRGSQKLDNVEDYINKRQKNLIDSDNKGLTKKLIDYYRKNGKVEDDNFIGDSFSKVRGSNYFKASKRIYNKTASALILADVYNNENSRFSQLDAASVWFADTVNQQFKMSSYNGNLTNLSSLTYRVLGNLKNEKPPINIDKLNLAITNIEKDLAGHYSLMRTDIGEKFAKCFEGEYKQCNGIEQFNINTAKALMELTNEINTNDSFNVNIKEKLKGDIGGRFRFNFLPGQYK